MNKKALLCISSIFATAAILGGCHDSGGISCNTTAECYPPYEICSPHGYCVKNPEYKGDYPGGNYPGGDYPGGGGQHEKIPQVSFKLNYGSYLFWLTESRWRSLMPGISDIGKGEIVIMLCNEDDPTCKDPVLARAVTAEEGYDPSSHPIQGGSGPEIHLYNLPAGTYNMMVFTDVPVTARNGLSCKDTLPNCTKGVDDWGCLVSEIDLMMVSNEDYDAFYKSNDKGKWGYYPQPKSRKITITAQKECTTSACTQDLDTIHLAHYHERNISPTPRPENGYIVVATAGGVRIVDLSNFKVLQAFDAEHVDYEMLDKNDNLIQDIPCGLIDGNDGKTVWIIYSTGTDRTRNNYAIPFDVQNKKQIGKKHVEFVSNVTNAEFCRGIVDKEGHMLVWSRAQGKPATDGSTVLYAPDLSNVLNDEEDVMTVSDSSIAYLDRQESLVSWHNTMYSIQGNISGRGSHQSSNGAGICSNDEAQCIFKTKLGEQGLEAITVKDDETTYIDNGAYFDKVDDKSCTIGDYFINVPSLALVEKSQTEAWLIASKCMSVSAWKLTYDSDTDSVSEERITLGDRPGVHALDTSHYGVFIHDWALSPDGKRLYGMPSGKSTTMLYHKLGEDKKLQSSNRILGLVLDVTGEKPVIASDAQFNRNIDDYEGNNDDKNPRSPAIDPGLDIQQHWYTQYFHSLTGSLGGMVTTFRPTRPRIVASENMLWLIRVGDGSREHDKTTTLGHQRDIATYDLKEARNILWPHLEETFYHPFSGATDEDRPSGFPLDQVHYDTINTMGIVYMPKKRN